LEELFNSNGWKTLLTIAESSGRPSSPPFTLDSDDPGSRHNGNGAGNNPPSQAFDDLGINSPAGGSSGGGGGDGGPRVCPHCTFVNEGSGSDCDICGLPLSG
jgi:nuclear protein localization family protein 4